MMDCGKKFALAGLTFGATMVCAPAVAGILLNFNEDEEPDTEAKPQIIKTIGSDITLPDSCEIVFKGITLDDFIFSPRKDGEAVTGGLRDTYDILAERFGPYGAREIFGRYCEKQVTEKDLKELKKSGINCIRVPLRSFLLFREENISKEEPLTDRLDAFVALCEKAGIKVIFSLRSAVGFDSDRKECTLFDTTKKRKKDPDNQENFVNLWSKLSEHYKENSTVAAYELLDSPDKVMTDGQLDMYYALCIKTAKEIRAAGDEHIIIINTPSEAFLNEIKSLGCAAGISLGSFTDENAEAYRGLINNYKANGIPCIALTDEIEKEDPALIFADDCRISSVNRIYKGGNIDHCMYCKVKEMIDLSKDGFDDINSKLAAAMETSTFVKFG